MEKTDPYRISKIKFDNLVYSKYKEKDNKKSYLCKISR